MDSKAKGGFARAASLTPEIRREIAKKAAEARWSKPRKRKPTIKEKVLAMTEMELRDTVRTAVAKYGRERAMEMLLERSKKDLEFLFAAARYGMEVSFAPIIAESAKDEPKH